MLSNPDAHDHGAHDLLSIAHMPFAGLVRGGFLASRKDRTSNSLSEPRMPFLMARRLSAEDSKRKPPRQPNLFSSVGHRHPPIDTVSSTFQTSICLLLLPFAKVGDLPHSGYYGNSVLSPEQKVRRGLSVPEDSSQAQRSVDLRPTTGNRPPECPFHPLPPRASPSPGPTGKILGPKRPVRNRCGGQRLCPYGWAHLRCGSQLSLRSSSH
jgi:hypothetical protein